MTRLGTFLYIRILKDGKDARFDHLKGAWLAFCGAWTLQACWVCVIQLLLLWLVGFGCECAADVQKFAFRLDAANRGAFITHGLWRYSRHPNYFGEILIWSSTALAVSVAGLRASDPSLLWAWLSPAFTALLLLRVSGIPMVEAAGTKQWGDDPRYRHYV